MSNYVPYIISEQVSPLLSISWNYDLFWHKSLVFKNKYRYYAPLQLATTEEQDTMHSLSNVIVCIFFNNDSPLTMIGYSYGKHCYTYTIISVRMFLSSFPLIMILMSTSVISWPIVSLWYDTRYILVNILMATGSL